jgi:hypothetical protein
MRRVDIRRRGIYVKYGRTGRLSVEHSEVSNMRAKMDSPQALEETERESRKEDDG